jgi:hypothetical protein
LNGKSCTTGCGFAGGGAAADAGGSCAADAGGGCAAADLGGGTVQACAASFQGATGGATGGVPGIGVAFATRGITAGGSFTGGGGTCSGPSHFSVAVGGEDFTAVGHFFFSGSASGCDDGGDDGGGREGAGGSRVGAGGSGAGVDDGSGAS